MDSVERTDGNVRMIDISEKAITNRFARAVGYIVLPEDVVELIRTGNVPKGDVLTTAKIAGIMGAKHTPYMVPLCHPIPITSVDIDFTIKKNAIGVMATVRTTARTGAEMEAIMAVEMALTTIYDMTKMLTPGIEFRSIKIIEKDGGKSGHVILPIAEGRVFSLAIGEKKGKGNFKHPVAEVRMDDGGFVGDAHNGTENPISAVLLESLHMVSEDMIEDMDNHWNERTYNMILCGIDPIVLDVGDVLEFSSGARMRVKSIGRELGRCTRGRYGLAAIHGIYLLPERGGIIKRGDRVRVFRSYE